MDLESRSNNFYEKRAIEVGFAVMCSSMHSFLMCAHRHLFAHTPCACMTHLSAATATVSMMASVQNKAQCVTWLAKSKSTVTVQHNFCHTHTGDPPVSKAIWLWFNQFKGSGTVEKHKSPGWWWISEQHVKLVRLLCQCSPKKSAAQILQLVISKTMNQNVLHNRLRLHTYKIQIL
jgi:hypothetical protein